NQKQKIQDLTTQVAGGEKKTLEQKETLKAKIADCQKEAVSKKEERVKRLEILTPDFAQGYEALRKSGKKVAVAHVSEDGTCGGCHMNVPPQTLNELKKGMSIQRCDCGRYLIQN